MRKYLIVIIIFISIAIGLHFFLTKNKQSAIPTTMNEIRYVALGDSYTIGEGVGESERYPNLLTKHLQEQGINIQLVANPATSGFTTQDLINNELEVLDRSNANFVTLLIGANDVVQGIDTATFQKNLEIIVDRIMQKLPEKNKLIIFTIPDFSVTSLGKDYDSAGLLNKEIEQRNAILIQEAKKRNLQIVDLFSLTKEMGSDHTLVAPDGLHPSSKEYEKWEAVIFPVAYDLLKSHQ